MVHKPKYNLSYAAAPSLQVCVRPNAEQQRDLRRFAGCCRFVFNQALALQKAHYEAGGKYIGYVAMAKLLTQWRRGTETPWLKQAPVHPLQQALKDLECSYQNFFAGRAGFPRFKRKGHRQSLRYPDATVSCSAGRWYASIQTERQVEPAHLAPARQGLKQRGRRHEYRGFKLG